MTIRKSFGPNEIATANKAGEQNPDDDPERMYKSILLAFLKRCELCTSNNQLDESQLAVSIV